MLTSHRIHLRELIELLNKHSNYTEHAEKVWGQTSFESVHVIF